MPPKVLWCAARFDSVKPISVLMVADNGTFSGTSEAVFVLDLLQSQNQAPAASTPCQDLYTGTLFGEKVVLAISGDLQSLALRAVHLRLGRACGKQARWGAAADHCGCAASRDTSAR